MVESNKWIVYEEDTTTGCEMEDGSDTRKYEKRTLLVPEHQEEEYNEDCADEYGYQDYSYQFNSKRIVELSNQQILEIAHKWIMALELSDVVNDRKKFEEIVEKLKHCIEYLEKDERGDESNE